MPSAICAAMPWPLGENLVQRVAAIVLGEWLDPIGLVLREIGYRQPAAMLAGVGRPALRQIAGVESLPLRLRDPLERSRGRRRGNTLSRPRRSAAPRQLRGTA